MASSASEIAISSPASQAQSSRRPSLKVEGSTSGFTAEACQAFLEEAEAGKQALAAAAEMKRLAGQINVVIHALGILLCLPHILEPGEKYRSA